ncbi:hypothetical protein BGU72_19670 [Clostridioides difficile]|nr:hypothetical protein BGU72_19670 [Clostridioides difficile]
MGWGRTLRRFGQDWGVNVGVRSEMWVRLPQAVNPRFPGEGSSALGESGPKLRPTGVGDGQQVDIPVLPITVCEMG